MTNTPKGKKYREYILKKLMQPEWTKIENLPFLRRLDHIANQAQSKATLEGYLTAFLVVLQLSEIFLRQLDKYSTFYIQLRVFPLEYPEKGLTRRTYGQIIGDVESGISNHATRRIIRKCQKLNEIRIALVHDLTAKRSVSQIKSKAHRAWLIYQEAYRLFLEVQDEYFTSYNKFARNISELRALR